MHVTQHDREAPHAAFSGVPLTVCFAEAEAIEAAREGRAETLPLTPPYNVSDEDAYFVLPDDIGMEMVDILHDGDLELLVEALRDGLLVIGGVTRARGRVSISVETAVRPADALREGLPYAATVPVGAGEDPTRAINLLDHAQCTCVSALVDDEGLDLILRRELYVGISWRVPRSAPDKLHIDPTSVWSRHLPDGRVAIELALFQEDDELVVLMRPVALEPSVH